MREVPDPFRANSHLQVYRYFTPVSTLSSRDCTSPVQGNYSAGITTPTNESQPIPRLCRMECSSTTTGHGISLPPGSPLSSTPVFKKISTFPTVIYQHSPPVRFHIRSEVTLPGSVPNPPPSSPYSIPSRSSKRGLNSPVAHRVQRDHVPWQGLFKVIVAILPGPLAP